MDNMCLERACSMGVKNIYRATNEVTGEVVEGYPNELAERIGVRADTIRQCTYRGKMIKNEWRTEVVYSGTQGVLKDGFTFEDARKWDDFTEPIRKYIRRRNAKKKQ